MMKFRKFGLAAALSATTLCQAQAAENGNTQYSPGSPQFYAASMPPYPGLYFLSQTNYFTADRTNDSNGDKVPIDFEVKALAETLRFLYVSDTRIGSAQVWGQLVVPVVHVDTSLPFGEDTALGLADITTSVGLAWHPDRKNSFVVGLDVALPTGKYEVSDIANIGTHHWSVQPTVGYHYSDPQGLEVATTARLIFNSENTETDYTSGTEFVLDYAVGWNVDKWRIGAVGYYLEQLEDDDGTAVAADGHRGKGFAIGPSLTYSVNPGMQFSASWQHDVFSENRAQGDAVWVNFATKF